MIRKVIPVAFSLFFLAACEKEITLDYNSIDPLHVIEGRITDETVEVLVTQTRDMENGVKNGGLDGASVRLSTGDGWEETLQYESDGYYRSVNGTTGEPGKTYTLSVAIGGNEYAASSQMQGSTRIGEVYFEWLKIISEKLLMCRFTFSDRAGEENYYYYRIFRNGKIYRWDVANDRGVDGSTILEDLSCMTEQMAKDNKEEDWDDILYEGDLITLEVQAIDRRAYDYLYSLGLSEQTSANPVAAFTGGCLGYFSACSADRKEVVFSFGDIRNF